MAHLDPVRPGTLYLVATPIGNLEDITLRALRILKEVDTIAAEDTRHSKKLLAHYGITAKLISYYREKEQQRAEQIVQMLRQGKNIALITDAGTPAISDPGAVIVQRCAEADLPIVPIPGPSAFSTALSCAGIQNGPVIFHGFLAAKSGQRRKHLQKLVHSEGYHIFYESPKRIRSFCTDALDTLGDRSIFLARELTKSFEELTHTTLAALQSNPEPLKEKGEYVVIISPAESVPLEEVDVPERIRWYRDNTELSLKDCSKVLAMELNLSKSEIYRQAVPIWNNKN